MFKFLFIIILVIIPIKIGIDIQNKMRERKKNLHELHNFFLSVKREVIFSKRKLSEIFEDNLELLSGKLREDFENQIESLSDIGLYDFFDRLDIDKRDKKILLTFAEGISKSEDSHDNLLACISENYEEANSAYNQNGKLYRSIGLASGLILGILFI